MARTKQFSWTTYKWLLTGNQSKSALSERFQRQPAHEHWKPDNLTCPLWREEEVVSYIRKVITEMILCMQVSETQQSSISEASRVPTRGACCPIWLTVRTSKWREHSWWSSKSEFIYAFLFCYRAAVLQDILGGPYIARDEIRKILRSKSVRSILANDAAQLLTSQRGCSLRTLTSAFDSEGSGAETSLENSEKKHTYHHPLWWNRWAPRSTLPSATISTVRNPDFL